MISVRYMAFHHGTKVSCSLCKLSKDSTWCLRELLRSGRARQGRAHRRASQISVKCTRQPVAHVGAHDSKVTTYSKGSKPASANKIFEISKFYFIQTHEILHNSCMQERIIATDRLPGWRSCIPAAIEKARNVTVTFATWLRTSRDDTRWLLQAKSIT